ncbi:hypothetical protein JL721_11573 [Aureococcus anophagefferens]|nr:hypothetical protein JL721_11573 [Aureococcus anophagefferens]
MALAGKLALVTADLTEPGACAHVVAAAEKELGGITTLASARAVVNISSVNGKQSFATLGAYCGSKAAIDHIARCAAVDLAPHGVRVNNINPGVTVTPLQQRGGMSDEAYAAFLERSANVTHPLGAATGDLSTPGDIADLALFLASNQSRFITGEVICVDGGRQCLGAR